MDFFLQQTVNGLVLGCVYALYALGFGLVMANLKVFFVTHAAVFTFGAIVAWQVTSRLGMPLWLAVIVAAIMSGLISVVGYYLLVRHLIGKRNPDLMIFISSLGGMIVLTELADQFLDGSVVRIPESAYTVSALSFGPIQLNTLQIAMVIVTLLLVVGISVLMKRTGFGRAVRSVAFRRDTSALLGINVDFVSAGVFFLAGALGGVAATFIGASFNVIDGHMGATYLVVALAAMVVGGFGSIPGVLVGGGLIGLASSYAVAFIGSAFRDIAVFALLMVFLIFRPAGIFKTNDDLQRV
jgi:branched-chain amino acid transport system permease protein